MRNNHGTEGAVSECILEGACPEGSRAAGASARRGSVGFGERTTPNAPLELEQILACVRETAYRWDFASDRIEWAANADTVLGVADTEKIARGRAFALRPL